jgi:capsular polysaccharide transport system permease protein
LSSQISSLSLLYSLRIQARVVHALLMREVITRYGRGGLGVLWLLVEPVLFTLGVASLWYAANMKNISDIPIIAFAITGYSSVLIWRNTTNRCTKAIEPNLALMYHRNVKVIDIFLSRILLEWIGATASILILTTLFSLSGMMQWPQDILLAMTGWLLLAWFSLALGLIVGAISELADFFERVWHVITYLLFPLSGAAFMVHWLPSQNAQDYILYLPMVHCVEAIRHGYFGQIVPTYEDLSYVVEFNLVLTLLGLALIRQAALRVQPE